jgi:DivIVA domain-containing protein
VNRDDIERRDFPTGRRGYDPEAVDQHLRRVADQFEAQLRAPRPSLAESTSEQVRAILDAAERGASELRAQAGGDVARVQEAAGGMLSKLDALQAELDRLLGALRDSGERLTSGLAELQASAAELAPARSEDSPARRPASPPAASPPADAVSPPAASPPDAVSPPAADAVSPPAAALPLAPAAASSPVPADSPAAPAADSLPAATNGASPSTDETGARLIALNMALGGTPREETARYLAEHFTLADAEALLDEVYSKAGG